MTVDSAAVTDQQIRGALELAALGVTSHQNLAIALRPGADWTGPGYSMVRATIVAYLAGYLPEPILGARYRGHTRPAELTKAGRWRLREILAATPDAGRQTLAHLWQRRNHAHRVPPLPAEGRR